MTKIRVLYFNGLGSGKPRHAERLAMKFAAWYLARHDISVGHIPVNWYAKESLSDLLQRMTMLVKEELAEHGSVTLCGVSAGGSLAVNLFSKLRSKNISVIVLCGPLKVAELPWWDNRTLERIAFRDPNRPSQVFFDSVTYCSTNAVPALTLDDKRHIVTVQQWADTVVPRATMGISGVRAFRVPGVGHALGIGISVMRLPAIIRSEL